MKDILKIMEENLSDSGKKLLRKIYEPTVVETPLSDSRCSICIMPDGEIRSYGLLLGDKCFTKCDASEHAYLSSKDCGISWTLNLCDKDCMGACTQVNDGVFVKIYEGPDGTYVKKSNTGADDTSCKAVKISDYKYFDIFLPVRSAYTNRIWVTAQRRLPDFQAISAFIYSDDFGETWSISELDPLPMQDVVFPHKGARWRVACGTEPYVCELSENEMLMILRNSTDAFYKSYSYDGGKTWSEPVPSTFYGDATTAFLLRLSDGRVINIWNNTKPLSELNHTKQTPPLPQSVIDGEWEDGFTNRDAAHAAISDDGGKTWHGYREILLNPVRNETDFRYNGGLQKFPNGLTGTIVTNGDKSVHQFQAFELPYGKILVSAGQNYVSRRMLIFDVNWLYETDRKEDFLAGLSGVSSHTFAKSIAGCTTMYGNGHCSFNRVQGARMMQDPEKIFTEAVLISKRHDENLVSDINGVVWNFPASKKGILRAEIKLIEKDVRITLTDRWYNPCDAYAGILSPFFFELDTDDIGTDFVSLEMEYDTESRRAKVTANGKFIYYVDMKGDCPTGISYIMVQCASDGDSKGLYLRLLEKHEK